MAPALSRRFVAMSLRSRRHPGNPDLSDLPTESQRSVGTARGYQAEGRGTKLLIEIPSDRQGT